MNQTEYQKVDVLIIGAGGAGLFCGAQAAKRGRNVLILDHAKTLGAKILISGGGRCNFTNTGASYKNYVSNNPHFCKSALSRFTPQDFIEVVKKHQIPFHEKKLGQLFCDFSAKAIVDLLKKECADSNAKILLETKIRRVLPGPGQVDSPRFTVETSSGVFESESLVIASGGLSIPKIGATGIGYEIAQQFGIKIKETAPALDGFVFSPEEVSLFSTLAGISVDSAVSCGELSFRENILFTHTGLSGPASLQASLHWYPGDKVTIDFLPDLDLEEWLLVQKQSVPNQHLKTLISNKLPTRFTEVLLKALHAPDGPISQVSNVAITELAQRIKHWSFTPLTTVGYNKAEVTRGGIDTDELSSKTMETKKVPGLYFIGEVVDVTGWLGGYNFQWAWASGWAAGQYA
jgi:predicted Rossmann fold flavoprotein